MNIKIYVNICENNFSLSHETKTRDTRTALDYVQIQRMCLNLNVDTYAVFSFFKKFRILRTYRDISSHPVESTDTKERKRRSFSCSDTNVR